MLTATKEEIFSAPMVRTDDCVFPLAAAGVYLSMWSLMAAPFLFSGDMTKLDTCTLNVLCNSEVIDIDQDSLGKQGTIVRKTNEDFILKKPLEDGSLAVGLFNLASAARRIAADWKDLGLKGSQRVRDVWREHDFGVFAGNFSARVPGHGVVLVRFAPTRLSPVHE